MGTGRIDRLMQAEGGLHLIANAPQWEGSEGFIELHDGSKCSQCLLMHAGALAIWACRAFTRVSDRCPLNFSRGRTQARSACV